MITLITIRQRLIAIAAHARAEDHEAAHSSERQLHVDVLRAVAAGKAGAREAQEALRSLELHFPRHVA